MRKRFLLWCALVSAAVAWAAGAAETTNALWAPGRIMEALRSLDTLKANGLISERQYERKRALLEERRAGRFTSTALATTDPAEINFIQNGGFEEINRNSARNRSRWLWWGGWSWGGDYENFWEARKENVHSGSYSAGIRCTGQPGRIGISTPKLPLVPGVKEYEFTIWAKGEGDNQLFLNFEAGIRGTLRKKIGSDWELVSLKGSADPGAEDFTLYIYVTGAGTIYLDDAKLVPVGEIPKE